jgi:hypothetical protein
MILESGILFTYLSGQKVKITIKIFERIKNPENYHLSHFEKKVYHKTAANPGETAFFHQHAVYHNIRGLFYNKPAAHNSKMEMNAI